MTDTDEITSLAREYAEFTDMSPADKRNISAICENFLKYTLRRYCLVEKEKAQQVKNCINTKAVDVVMNLLFPDLRKEVES